MYPEALISKTFRNSGWKWNKWIAIQVKLREETREIHIDVERYFGESDYYNQSFIIMMRFRLFIQSKQEH